METHGPASSRSPHGRARDGDERARRAHPWRGTGSARLIHDHLLAQRPELRAGLTVNPAAGDGKVQRLYESWGYVAIGTQQPSPDSPPLVAMLRSMSPT